MELLRDRINRLRTESGATLIEMLVALSILSIAGVAVLAGLQMSIFASDIHRKQSTGGAYVRTYAEAIQRYLDDNAHYVPCASANTYAPGVVGFTEPTGFTASHAAVVPLAGNGQAASCPGGDTGVQRVRLQVRANDGRATESLTIVLRRSCGSGSTCS